MQSVPCPIFYNSDPVYKDTWKSLASNLVETNDFEPFNEFTTGNDTFNCSALYDKLFSGIHCLVSRQVASILDGFD